MDIDLERPKEQLGIRSEIIPFRVEELYDRLNLCLAKTQIQGLSVRDVVYVNGRDVGRERWILPNRFARPLPTIDPRVLRNLMNVGGPNFRHYKWIQIHDWGSELIISYLVRYTRRRDDSLFVEVSKHLLTPLQERYRRVDKLLKDEGWRALLRSLNDLFAAPFALALSWFALYGKLVVSWRDLLGVEERRIRADIKRNPLYDYGSSRSLREALSGDFYEHYFQKMDQEMYHKIIERQLLNTLVDFLDEHGIDTRELKEHQTAILNQGIIVQGGSVNAQAMAVGKGAQAGVKQKSDRKPRSSILRRKDAA